MYTHTNIPPLTYTESVSYDPSQPQIRQPNSHLTELRVRCNSAASVLKTFETNRKRSRGSHYFFCCTSPSLERVDSKIFEILNNLAQNKVTLPTQETLISSKKSLENCILTFKGTQEVESACNPVINTLRQLIEISNQHPSCPPPTPISISPINSSLGPIGGQHNTRGFTNLTPTEHLQKPQFSPKDASSDSSHSGSHPWDIFPHAPSATPVNDGDQKSDHCLTENRPLGPSRSQSLSDYKGEIRRDPPFESEELENAANFQNLDDRNSDKSNALGRVCRDPSNPELVPPASPRDNAHIIDAVLTASFPSIPGLRHSNSILGDAFRSIDSLASE